MARLVLPRDIEPGDRVVDARTGKRVTVQRVIPATVSYIVTHSGGWMRIPKDERVEVVG